MAAYYDNLLRLCGFQAEEVKDERPRIEKAFERLGIGPDDMDMAEGWTREHHDVELEGSRRLLGAWLRELIDMVLAKDEGKKVIYYGFPAMVRPGMLIKASSENIYCACPDAVLCHTMGQIFNKLTPLLEAGEENGLPPGHSLCSLWQVKVGALVTGVIPEPDMAIASSYFCDMGSKADDLLAEKYGTPIFYVDGSMDSAWQEYPGCLSERVKFLGAQLDQLFDKLKETIGVEITPQAWDKTAKVAVEYYSRLGKLTELMRADPVPVSAVEMGLATILGAAVTGRGVPEAYQAMDILTKETQQRLSEGIGVVEKGAPRVLFLVSNFSDASVIRMIEKTGLAMPASFFTMPPPKIKSETVCSTFGEKMADTEMRVGLYHSGYAMAKRLEMATDHMEFDGMICNYLFNCRPVAIMSHIAKKWVEKNTGLPVLALENDIYDTRSFSAGAMQTRVETFAEMLKARKTAAAA